MKPAPSASSPAAAYRPFDSALAAIALFLVTGAVNLEMPLYRAYASRAGYGNGMTTLMFASYIAGLLPALLCLGGLSDRLGRKPVLAAGIACALAATGLMLWEPGMRLLFPARVLQGLGVGLSMGAGSAYLAQALRGPRAVPRSASLVAVATSLGFGGGALFTGTLLLSGTALRPASYPVHAGLCVLCLLSMAAMRGDRPAGGSLLRLPHFPPGSVPLGLTITLAWAVTGVVISLVPAQLARHGQSAWAGHALFLVNGTGAAIQPFARRMDSRRALMLGALLLPIGYASLLYGAWTGTLAWALAGAAIAGSACYGFTYLGGLAGVSLRGGERRARAVSGYFVFAYLGFGLPSVGLGFLADRFGLMPTLAGFGALLPGLCAWQAAWARSLPRTAP